MRKRIIALFLSVLMIISMVTVNASAIFLETLGAVGSVASIVGTGLSALQICGVFGDDTSTQLKKMNKTLNEMKGQLNEMDTKLDAVNSKLDALSSQMSKQLADIKKEIQDVQQKEIVNEMYNLILLRKSDATQTKAAWSSFVTDYQEKMKEGMSLYRTKLNFGMAEWCQNPSSRSSSAHGVKNSSIIVAFREEDGELIQEFTYQNSVSALDDDVKYVVIGKDLLDNLLPEDFLFEADTYKNTVIKELKNVIIEKAKSDYQFNVNGIPELSPEKQASISDEFAQFIANAAFNSLCYRISCNVVNENADLQLIPNKFEDYMTHLMNQGEGLDAYIRTLYLTHIFEYELKGTITDFCDSIGYSTFIYGLLASDILSVSRSVENKQSKIDSFGKRLEKCLETIEAVSEQSYTGYDNYCYLTNSLIHLGELEFNYSITVEPYGRSDCRTPRAKLSKGTAVGRETDTSSREINDYVALLMSKCTAKEPGESFASYLNKIGAYDYKETGKPDRFTHIMIKNTGECSSATNTDFNSFYMVNPIKNEKLDGTFTYSQAKDYLGQKADARAFLKYQTDCLDTENNKIVFDDNVIGFTLLVTKEEKKDALRLCSTPFECSSSFVEGTPQSGSYYNDYPCGTVTATARAGYLYQTALPAGTLGNLSPLHNLDTSYLSSIFSNGNIWLIIILGCVALATAGIIIVIVIKKKKTGKKCNCEENDADNEECSEETESKEQITAESTANEETESVKQE